MKTRKFKKDVLQHIYNKEVNGNGIFYEREDYIYFLTLLACLARKYGVQISGVTVMFNHVHELASFQSKKIMSVFESVLECTFAREYNVWHNRTGQLFNHPFGNAPKYIGKNIKSAYAYVANNPVVGNICKNVLEYRWNLLAYYNNPNPYSKKIILRKCRRSMKNSVKIVDDYAEHNTPLTYSVQRRIFKKLNEEEIEQITDYIITKYNIVDYEEINKHFGSFDRALSAFEVNTGSEYEIKEDWEDYSLYDKMLEYVGGKIDFAHLSEKKINDLQNTFEIEFKIPQKQVKKFLRRYKKKTDHQ